MTSVPGKTLEKTMALFPYNGALPLLLQAQKQLVSASSWKSFLAARKIDRHWPSFPDAPCQSLIKGVPSCQIQSTAGSVI